MAPFNSPFFVTFSPSPKRQSILELNLQDFTYSFADSKGPLCTSPAITNSARLRLISSTAKYP